MNQISVAHLCRLFAAGLCLIAVCACSTLRPAATPNAAFYSLEGTRGAAPAAVPTTAPAAAPTLIINPPHAAAGFDSPRIIYVDRKSTRLNSSHANLSYAVFCLKKKQNETLRSYSFARLLASTLLSSRAPDV